MISKNFLAILAVASLTAAPAIAQTTTKDPEMSGHHYQGGPATSTPHHMGEKK